MSSKFYIALTIPLPRDSPMGKKRGTVNKMLKILHFSFIRSFLLLQRYHIPAMFAQPPKGKHGATHIITGSEDGKIIFYDLQSRNIAFTLPGHKGTR